MLRRNSIQIARLARRSGFSLPPNNVAALTVSGCHEAGRSQPKVNFSTSLTLARSKFRHSRYYVPVLHELWRRREEVGPEKPKHRSEEPNWNYEAELYGFCKRLGEEWERETLVEAFTERAYAEAEAQRRAELSVKWQENVEADNLPVPSIDMGVLSNDNLAKRGETVCKAYIKAFLHHSLPAYPDEGVSAVCNFLMSDDLLGYVCKNIGTADLIMSTEFPPAVKVYANVMKALIGGLDRDQSRERACHFAHDFILTQLSGRDINQFWEITNPMVLLAETMKKPAEKGGAGCKGEPEPRIIWQTGISTPLAAYKVGIYDSVSKKLLGQGGGETAMIAEEMAALDALYRIFGTQDAMLPLEFGQEARRSGLAEKVSRQS